MLICCLRHDEFGYLQRSVEDVLIFGTLSGPSSTTVSYSYNAQRLNCLCDLFYIYSERDCCLENDPHL